MNKRYYLTMAGIAALALPYTMKISWAAGKQPASPIADNEKPPVVVTYSAPTGELLSTVYEVTANGRKVDAYTARVLDPPFGGQEWDYGGPHSFANCDIAGRVTVRIKSPRLLRNTVIRPKSAVVDMTVEDDHTVENVRLHGEGQHQFICLNPVVNQYMQKKVPGFVRNVRFRNVTIEGAAGEYLVQLKGADAEHNVRMVTFENITINGQPLAKGQNRLRIGKHVEDIRFAHTCHLDTNDTHMISAATNKTEKTFMLPGKVEN